MTPRTRGALLVVLTAAAAAWALVAHGQVLADRYLEQNNPDTDHR